MPFPVHSCLSQLLFTQEGDGDTGIGLRCSWGQALLCHTLRGDSPGGQPGREAGGFCRTMLGCRLDIPKHSAPGHVPDASPQPSPSSQSHGADAATAAMESRGGVGNKWGNQTNPRESGSNLGFAALVSAQGRYPLPTAFAPSQQSAGAELLNINISLNKHPVSQTLSLHLR